MNQTQTFSKWGRGDENSSLNYDWTMTTLHVLPCVGSMCSNQTQEYVINASVTTIQEEMARLSTWGGEKAMSADTAVLTPMVYFLWFVSTDLWGGGRSHHSCALDPLRFLLACEAYCTTRLCVLLRTLWLLVCVCVCRFCPLPIALLFMRNTPNDFPLSSSRQRKKG